MNASRLDGQSLLVALNGIGVGRQRLAVFSAATALLYVSPLLFVAVVIAASVYLLPGYLSAISGLMLLRQEAEGHDKAMTRIQYGLDTAIARIDELDGELTEAKRRLAATPAAVDPLYRRVGLSNDCPDFVLAAARKAYRIKLHPDRVSERLKIAAHARFVAAEAAFDEIEKRRRIS